MATTAQHLHIVSFNVPWPADYGGVIDVYHRVRTLAAMGVKVHLHCYAYGRGVAAELAALCEEVCYYERPLSWRQMLSRRPFIVATRSSEQLIERLLKDDYPILLEGLHCCDVLQRLRAMPTQQRRVIMVRAHNVEHDYYRGLARTECLLWRRFYMMLEACKLQRYESVVLSASAVLCVSHADEEHFRSLGVERVVYMPSSHPNDSVSAPLGMGHTLLYHADLSVGENVEAVAYLVRHVFSRVAYPVVIAGRNPSQLVRRMAALHSNITLVASPSDEAMRALIADAHIVVMTTAQPTGLKLKLLNSLYGARHCVVNTNMVAGTELRDLCHVADSPEAMLLMIDSLMHTPFDAVERSRRQQVLDRYYSNRRNARVLMELLG